MATHTKSIAGGHWWAIDNPIAAHDLKSVYRYRVFHTHIDQCLARRPRFTNCSNQDIACYKISRNRNFLTINMIHSDSSVNQSDWSTHESEWIVSGQRFFRAAMRKWSQPIWTCTHSHKRARARAHTHTHTRTHARTHTPSVLNKNAPLVVRIRKKKRHQMQSLKIVQVRSDLSSRPGETCHHIMRKNDRRQKHP